MPLSGVRISWPHVGQEVAWARLAVSAVSLASFKAELRPLDLLFEVIRICRCCSMRVSCSSMASAMGNLVRCHQHVALGQEVFDARVQLFVDLVEREELAGIGGRASVDRSGSVSELAPAVSVSSAPNRCWLKLSRSGR